MDEETFILLWRSLLRDGWFMSLTDSQKWAWIGLLLQVNFAPSEYCCYRCDKEFKLPAGATAKTYRNLAKEAQVGEQVLRTVLRKAVNKGNVTILDRARCHVLYAVENWDKYQGPNAKPTQSQRKANAGITKEQDLSSTKRGSQASKRKAKKGRTAEELLLLFPEDHPARRIMRGWMKTISYLQTAAAQAEHEDGWLDALEKLHRLDGHSWQDIGRLAKWVAQDSFWCTNVESPAKLRKKKDGVKYYDRLWRKMTSGPPPRGPKGGRMPTGDQMKAEAAKVNERFNFNGGGKSK